MNVTLQTAEDHVAILIEETNRTHIDDATSGWTYELTTEVANIGIVVSETAQTLLVNPCWLRFVVSSGDFKACVADEIVAWYLIRQFVSSEEFEGRTVDVTGPSRNIGPANSQQPTATSFVQNI